MKTPVYFNKDLSQSASNLAEPSEHGVGLARFGQEVQSNTTALLSNAPNSDNAEGVSSSSVPIAKLYLLGPFGLCGGQGQNFTPRIKKAQALLALLALAPRKERTRVWLRDKLWSQQDEAKSSTNLRQLIFELRKGLGNLADQVLRVERNTIGLHTDALWVDYWAVQANPSELATLEITPDTELLEGLDIRDEEFEDWLLLERQIWCDKYEKLAARQSDMPAPPPVPKPTPVFVQQPTPELRYSLGFLPNIQQGCDANTIYLADHLLEGIAQNLRELVPVDFQDLREANAHSDALLGAFDTEFYIRVRTLQVNNNLTLTFFLYSAARMTLEWSQSIQVGLEDLNDPDSYVLAGFITQNVDRLAKFLLRKPQPDPDTGTSPIAAGYTALNMMFRLDDNALSNAETILGRMTSQSSDTLYSALRAYASSFKVGENLGGLEGFSHSETRSLAQFALDDNPFNSVSLAGLAHTMGYVFGEHDRAGELLENALSLNANQAFVWDHYALHKHYIGDHEAAHKAAQRAVYLGSFSPISFTYDTTLAMTSTMIGDTGQAIAASKNALRKQPRFHAAMRYLVANLGIAERADEARSVYQNLLQSDPDFADREVMKERFRIAQKDKEDSLIKAIALFAE